MRLALRWSLVRFVGIAVPLTLMGPLALSGTAVSALVAHVGVGGYAVGFAATLLLALLAVVISPRVVR